MHKGSRIIGATIAVVLTLGGLAAPATAGPAAELSQTSSSPVASSDTAAAIAATVSYTVHAGDTLGAIAQRFCGTFSAYRSLAAASGIRNPNLIYPGQRVTLACKTKPSTRPAPPKASRSTPRTGAWHAPLAHWTLTCSNSFHSGARPTHAGLDLMSPWGRPIYAVGAGTVMAKSWEAKAGYYVALNHGTFKTVYMHMRAPSFLRIGAHVNAGDVIGYVGQTGNATAPHVHFEVHRTLWTDRINPAPWLRSHGIAVNC